MGEYLFGASNKKLSRTEARRMARIAKKHGAVFVEGNPTEGDHHWFAVESCGNPFDRELRDAVLGEIGILEETNRMIGRPTVPIDEKKVTVSYRIAPDLAAFLKARPGRARAMVEHALRETYQIK